MVKADVSANSETTLDAWATPQRPSLDAAPGAITAALRPRELQVKIFDSRKGVRFDDIVPWIRQQRQLRSLNIIVDDEEGVDAVVEVVSGAGVDLEELVLDLPEDTRASDLNSTIYASVTSPSNGVRTLSFPGLRVLRMPDAEIGGSDLRNLAAAARALEVLAVGKERKSVTPNDWSQVLRQMTHLHTLLIRTEGLSKSTTRTSAVTMLPFYAALIPRNFTPACPLRVLKCIFEPTPDSMHMVLGAVEFHLPHLKSFALPVEIFNALALVETADVIAKQELRGAVQAVMRRCSGFELGRFYKDSAELHINALQELLSCLPDLEQLELPIISDEFEETPALRHVLTRSTAAQTRTAAGCERAESQVRDLELRGPLSHADLVTVARACPHLRVLKCEYGGPRPLVQMRDDWLPRFVPLMAEAVFVDWLGVIIDVGAAKYVTAATAAAGPTAAAAAVQPQVLRGLRQLRVANPPFDSERDAAGMHVLERVRAHSHVLIEFKAE
jgi:hypothetical protein